MNQWQHQVIDPLAMARAPLRTGMWLPHFKGEFACSLKDRSLNGDQFAQKILGYVHRWARERTRIHSDSFSLGEANLELSNNALGTKVGFSSFKCNKDQQNEVPPNLAWVVQVEHSCSEFQSGRRWQATVGFGLPSANEPTATLTISTMYQDSTPLADPVLSVPLINRMIRDLPDVIFTRGGLQLSRAPTYLDSPAVLARFVNLLRDPDRVLPLVLLSFRHAGTQPFAIDADKLASSLTGVAQVFVEAPLRVNWNTKFLSGAPREVAIEGMVEIMQAIHSLEKDYLVWGGAVRVYPGNALTVSQWRSPYLDYRELLELEHEARCQTVKDLCIKIGVGSIESHDSGLTVATPSDIQRIRNDATIHELRKLRESAPSDPDNTDIQLADAYAKEADALRGVNNGLRNTVKEQREEILNLRSQVAALNETVKRMSEQLSLLKSGSANERNTATLSFDIPEIVESAMTAWELVSSRFADRIVASPQGEESIARFEAGDRADLGLYRTLAEAFLDIATKLWECKFTGKEEHFLNAYNSASQFKLALSESSNTRRRGDLISARVDSTYDSEPREVQIHIKYGNQPGKQFRIHLFFDEAKRKIVVSQVVDHLPTSRSNKRGGRRG